jgi:hypothetical protein
MAETRERMQRLRKKRKDQDEKAMEIWLDPASQGRLVRLRQPGESVSAVIRRALVALDTHAAHGYPSASGQPGTRDEPGRHPREERREPLPQPTPETGDITSNVTSNVTSGTLRDLANPLLRKAAVLKRLRAMQAEGLSLQAMANRLNAERIPTLSVKGQWQKGTIGNLLAQGEKR